MVNRESEGWIVSSVEVISTKAVLGAEVRCGDVRELDAELTAGLARHCQVAHRVAVVADVLDAAAPFHAALQTVGIAGFDKSERARLAEQLARVTPGGLRRLIQQAQTL